MSPLKITIREIDNGFMVESNHKSLYRYGSEVFDRARVEELFTKTLPEAVTLVREMGDEYVRKKEEAEQSHKVDYSSVTRDRLKDLLGTIDSLTAQSGADVSLEALKSAFSGKYGGEEIERLIDLLVKGRMIYFTRRGYVKKVS